MRDAMLVANDCIRAHESLSGIVADVIEADRAEHVREIRKKINNKFLVEGLVYRPALIKDVLALPCLQLPKPQLDPRAVAAAKQFSTLSFFGRSTDEFEQALAEVIDRHFKGKP